IAARSLRLVQAATPTGLSDALGNCPLAERGSLEPHLVALPFLVGMDLATATRADGAERAQVARLATHLSHEPVRKEGRADRRVLATRGAGLKLVDHVVSPRSGSVTPISGSATGPVKRRRSGPPNDVIGGQGVERPLRGRVLV